MKLIAVCRVKNEIDIIEAFVRHHAQYFDKLIIMDDGSADKTYDALKSLRAAGLPLVLLQAPVVGYEQSYYMTLLLRMAVYQFGADWVAPLDADEFVEVKGEMTLAEIVAAQEPSLIALPWNNFIWRLEHKTSLDLNPVLRMRFRLPPRHDMMKVLVPAKLVDGNVRLLQGNHTLMRDEEVLPAHPLPSVGICHFPIRNLLQYSSKVVVGYLQYSSMPDWDRKIGFQYIKPFEALIADGLRGIEQRMAKDSCHYSEEFPSSNAAEPREEPLRYQGGLLTVTPSSQENFYCNVLRHAETVAQERARLSRSEASLEKKLAKLERELLDTSKRHAETVAQERARLSQSEASLEKKLAKLERELLDTSKEHAAMLTFSQQLAEDKAAVERRLATLEIELLATREVNFVQSERLSSRSYKLLDVVYRRLTALGIAPRLVSNCVFWLLRIK
jgi:hypothetical protein